MYEPGPEFAAETPLQTLLALAYLNRQIRSDTGGRNSSATESLRAIATALYRLTIEQSEPGEVIRFSAEQARAIPGADGAAIALERGRTFVCVSRSGERAPELDAGFDSGTGISGECIRTGAILRCDDTEDDGRVNKVASRALGIRSMVAVPIHHRRRVAGVLEVFSGEPRAFAGLDLSRLELLSALITHALERELIDREDLRQDTGTRATAIAIGQSEIEGTDRGRRLGVVLGAVAAVALTIGAMGFLKTTSVSLNARPDAPSQAQTGPAEIRAIEFRSHPDFTAVKVSVARTVPVKTERLSNPERVYFDLVNTEPLGALGQKITVNDPFVSQILLSQPEEGLTRITLDLNCRCDYAFVLPNRKPYELSIVVQPPKGAAPRIPSQNRGSSAKRF